MTQVLRTLNEWVILADKKNDAMAIEELAAASFPYLLVQILWFLDPEMAIWKVPKTSSYPLSFCSVCFCFFRKLLFVPFITFVGKRKRRWNQC